MYSQDTTALRGDEAWAEAEASVDCFSLDAALLLSFVAEGHGDATGGGESDDDDDGSNGSDGSDGVDDDADDDDAMSKGFNPYAEQELNLDELGLR
tara:strand:+ start:311 stop:598 length:288 start_codon:yes stop_codon:yes gene_type:complete